MREDQTPKKKFAFAMAKAYHRFYCMLVIQDSANAYERSAFEFIIAFFAKAALGTAAALWAYRKSSRRQTESVHTYLSPLH